uniref:C2H2-type domain-containing protein n=1 Tax=Mesocestoides corti TaxID=53468 RepID=A0A5K3EZR3_MESCO
MFPSSDYQPSPSSEFIPPLDDKQQSENAVEAVDLDAVQKIQASMPAADPEAPVGSNKNPIRIIQQGSQFITTQDVSDSNLHQIVQVLANQALVDESKNGGKVLAIYNRLTNKRIVFRVTHGRRKRQGGELSEVRDHYSLAPPNGGERKRRRGRRPGQKKKTPDEEDPDFEPDLPEEEVLPFPIVRKRAPAKSTDNNLVTGRVSKPPKYLIKDYKHLRLEDLKEDEDRGDRDAANVSSGEDSNVGYSDYNAGSDLNSEGEENATMKPLSRGFDCQLCGKSFASRAGLSRHNMLKHNPDGKVKRVGPWSDPVLSAIRRRNRLSEALEKATPEDLIDLAGPKVANVLPLWDYLFLRSEDPSPGFAARTPVRPPKLSRLVFEYLTLVSTFREFIEKQLELVDKEPCDADLKQEQEAEEILAGQPAPASVKRRRYLQRLRRQKELAELNNGNVNRDNDSEATHPDKDLTNPPKKTVTHLRLSGSENMSVTETSRAGAPQTTGRDCDEAVIQVRCQTEASALSLPMGRYKPRLPFPDDRLPRRYRPVTSAPPTDNHSSDESRRAEPALKRAVITSVEHNDLIEAISENQPCDETDCEALVPEPSETEKVTESVKVSAIVGENSSLYLHPEGLGYPVPDDWITSGSFLPVLMESGALSDLAVEAASGRIFHRPTGQLVSAAPEGVVAQPPTDERVDSSQAPEEVLVKSDPVAPVTSEISVSEVSPTTCLVTTPNGVQFQVLHGGEGITMETLQAILEMENT